MRVLGAHEYASIGPQRASNDYRGENTGRRGVLDVSLELVRKPQELTQPVHRQLLELLQSRRRPPENPDLVQTRDQELGEHARLRPCGREVREETRALPVGQAGE